MGEDEANNTGSSGDEKPCRSWQRLIDHDYSREISTDRHPADDMYQNDEAAYLQTGREALRIVGLALAGVDRPTDEVHRILDLPSGYGRVARYLRAGFPDAEIVACDIFEEGVAFCERTLGCKPVAGKKSILDTEIEGYFDLIFCGSLLTHVDRAQWQDVLDLFTRHLSLRGLLVFTTLGRIGHQLLAFGATYGLDEAARERLLIASRSEPFAYENYHGFSDYGIAVASPAWTVKLLGERYDALRLLGYHEGGWCVHQDVVVCESIAGIENDPTTMRNIANSVAALQGARS
ncbi:MAG: methyltransferase domain-containing protein [Planctomycetes bacterium]|nr:methyltransferase domain-containing protein [Planctomycetota bacterium]